MKELFRLSEVDETLRPQALTLEEFGALSNAYGQLAQSEHWNTSILTAQTLSL